MQVISTLTALTIANFRCSLTADTALLASLLRAKSGSHEQ